MDSVTSATNFLIQQMQSHATVEKASPKAEASSDVGNMMDAFGSMLSTQMQYINKTQEEASKAQQTYATGGDIELHNVILSTEKADLSMQLAMQIRNKMIDAYQEVSRMSV